MFTKNNLSSFDLFVFWFNCVAFLPTILCGFSAHCSCNVAFLLVAAMAAQEDPFLYMCRAFGQHLTPDELRYWDFAMHNYENGLWSQQLMVMTLEGFQSRQAASAPSTPSTTASSWPNARPQSFQPPPQQPQSFQQSPQQQPFVDLFSPGTWPKLSQQQQQPPKGYPKGNKMGPQQQHQPNQKGQKGDGMAFLPTKGDPKGKGKDKNKFRFPVREIVATDRADSVRRLKRFMDEYEAYVFRPREDVPRQFETVYESLGESGPQMYKNLRHHLKGEAGLKITGRLLQFIAERSHWKVDKMNHIERNRKVKREKDAQSSRMSVASGFTGMSTQTAAWSIDNWLCLFWSVESGRITHQQKLCLFWPFFCFCSFTFNVGSCDGAIMAKAGTENKKQLYVAVLISCFVLHFVMIAPRTKGSSQMNCVFSDQEFAVSPSMFT